MKRFINKWDKYIFVYFFIVLFIFTAVYVTVRISGYMYMFGGIGADTYAGQLPSLAYAKHLLSEIKLYDFDFGLGMSTIGAIANILDPFNWPCFFFSDYNLDYGIFIGVFLRYICLAYYAYKYIGIKQITGLTRIMCSLMITFSGWFVGWGQHYCIGTVFVAFIAILHYFECWLQKREFVKLVLSVAFLTIVSLYFCYMVLIFLMFYYFISLYFIVKRDRMPIKQIILHMLQTALLMICALCCSSIVFFANFGETVASSRVSGTYPFSFSLATLKEYASFIFRMLSNSILGIDFVFWGYGNYYESPYMYIGILAAMLIPVFLMQKKYLKKYWISIGLIIITIVFVNFSAVIFNGFSTKTYRWTFIFIPVFSLACGKILSGLPTLKYKKSIIIVTILWDIILAIFYFWFKSHYKYDYVIWISFFSVIFFLNIYAIVFFKFSNKRYFYSVLLLLLSIELGVNAYISVHDRPLITQNYKNEMGYYDDTSKAIQYLEEIDSSFYRISKKYNIIDLNDSLIQHYRGEKVYTSILSGAMWDLIDVFDLRVPQSNYFYGFDDKQILRDLTVGKYRLTKVQADYYGYEFVDKIGDIYIYKNLNCLGFGVLYDNVELLSSIYDNDAYELQSKLLQTCIIDDSDYDEHIDSFLRTDINLTEISSTLIYKEEDIYKSSYGLKKDFYNKNPLLIKIGGENASGSIEIYIRNKEKDGKKRVSVDSIPYTNINGEKTFYIDTLNISAIKIKGSDGELKEFSIYELNGDELTNYIEELNENHMKIIDFSDTSFSGYAECNGNKLLFIPIPYSNNWKVSVNGENMKVYKANAGFMAILLHEGYSEIEIEYKPSYFYFGCIVSGFSLFVLFIIVFVDKERRKII